MIKLPPVRVRSSRAINLTRKNVREYYGKKNIPSATRVVFDFNPTYNVIPPDAKSPEGKEYHRLLVRAEKIVARPVRETAA